jgi:aspartate racemase
LAIEQYERISSRVFHSSPPASTNCPLVLQHGEAFMIKGHQVALIDPTTILAMKCIQLAREHSGERSNLYLG